MMRVLLFPVLAATLWMACTSKPAKEAQPPQPAAHAQDSSIAQQMVVTYHPVATQIGYDVLNSGGNAFDAFVAATAAEYVLGEGVTSLGGPLGALLFDTKTQSSFYLDAGFNQPLDPQQKWSPKHPEIGTTVLVPGAIAGLEAISKAHGRMPFALALEPAIQLAEKGFPVNRLYADLIKANAAKLKRTLYGKETFFRNGEPLAEGETLKLPELAKTLRTLGEQGSRALYEGPFAEACIQVANDYGGHLKLDDFKRYHPRWEKPFRTTYRGLDIDSPRTSGALTSLLALKVFESLGSKPEPHYMTTPAGLEEITRIEHAVEGEKWLFEPMQIRRASSLEAHFQPARIHEIAARVKAQLASGVSTSSDADEPIPLKPVAPGSHSYQIVVIDHDGNAITGTNTIESFPFGEGLFAGGVPLTASGKLPFPSLGPGTRRGSSLTMHLGTHDGNVVFASGAFSFSMIPAEFQFIVNTVDYALPPEDALSRPRIGSPAWDLTNGKLLQGSDGGPWLDPRIDYAMVLKLGARGLTYVQKGYYDTGLGAMAIRNPDHSVDGAIAPMSSIGTNLGPMVGIGAELERSPDGDIRIRKLLAHSPAQEVGLAPGDILISARKDANSPEVSLEGQEPELAMSLLRGEAGTTVVLKVRQDSGEVRTFSIVRAAFRVPDKDDQNR